jgi:hypothetical protein
MTANRYSDVDGIAHALYPLESYLSFNPVIKSWFPLAITDELLLHTVLFSAAVTMSFKAEHGQSAEASNIMKPIFHLLTSRLKDHSKISDATIGAVSCLAMIEVNCYPQLATSDSDADTYNRTCLVIMPSGKSMQQASPRWSEQEVVCRRLTWDCK